jgi:O-antigen/teichoic acid export membrane protein
MGIIARQGSKNAIYIMAGIGVGAISNIFIYPTFFRNDLDYLGFLQLFITTAALFAPFLTLGSIGVAVRYYPKLIKEGKENLLNYFSWFYPIIGLILFSIFLYFFGDFVIEKFLKENFVERNLFLIGLFLLTLLMTYFRSLSSISIAKTKTGITIILNEVYIRLALLCGLFLVFLEIISLKEYFIFHLLAYGSQLILLIIIYRKDYFVKIIQPTWKEAKEITVYGLNTLFDNVASLVVNKADIFMIAFYLSLEKVAIYNLAFFMSTVITIPNRAIMIIAAPMIARSVHDNDYKNVQDIYQKSSLTQFLAGGLIFTLIVCNFNQILVIGNLPFEYKEAELVLLFLGISKLIDLIGSVNGSILLATPLFRFNLYFNLILLIITILLNIIFIPLYGIIGAAVATTISLALFNIMKGVFLYLKYQLQPFHKNTFIGFLILTITFCAGFFLPQFDNVYLDLILRSIIICLVFIPTVIYLKVSEDINTMFYKIVRRFFK